jgi:hypothetical protein
MFEYFQAASMPAVSYIQHASRSSSYYSSASADDLSNMNITAAATSKSTAVDKTWLGRLNTGWSLNKPGVTITKHTT